MSSSGVGVGISPSLLPSSGDEFDAALLVLEAVEQRGRGLGRGDLGGDGAGDLAAERVAALLGDEPRLGEAGPANQLLKAVFVELAVDPAERRVVLDVLHHIGIGHAEPELARPLVERGAGDHLAQDLLLEAERTRLVGRDRTAQLLAELLEPLIVLLAELVDRNLGAADLGDRRDAEPAENVADAPDAEADDEEQHDRRHDDAAEPVGRGFS